MQHLNSRFRSGLKDMRPELLKYKNEEIRFKKAISGLDAEQVDQYIEDNYDNFFKSMPSGDHKKRILKKIYKKTMAEDPQQGKHLVNLTLEEVKFLQSLPTDEIKRLFYCLIIRSKVCPHPSGWISLNFDETLLYGYTLKQSLEIRAERASECVPYGVDFLVRGSTKPVVCFKLRDFDESDVVISFLDGEALHKFKEVMRYDCHTD